MLFGTYTSAGSLRTTGLRSPTASAAYTFKPAPRSPAGRGGGLGGRVEVAVLDELLARVWLDPQPASSSAPSA
ncbi:MAG: hypothetical protein WB557_33365, partial [Solirubrobacteraceae bacterium]